MTSCMDLSGQAAIENMARPPAPKWPVVNLSAFECIERPARERVEKEIATELARLSKRMPVEEITMHLRRYTHGGGETKYALKGMLAADGRFFHADAHDWNLSAAAKMLIKRLEREAIKKRASK